MEEHTLASIYELLDAVAASVRELAASVGELAASVGELTASVRELHERFDGLEANQKTLIETVNGILGALESHEERIERLEAPV